MRKESARSAIGVLDFGLNAGAGAGGSARLGDTNGRLGRRLHTRVGGVGADGEASLENLKSVPYGPGDRVLSICQPKLALDSKYAWSSGDDSSCARTARWRGRTCKATRLSS